MLSFSLLFPSLKPYARKMLESLFYISVRKAGEESGLMKLEEELKRIVPDITAQYSSFSIDTEYLRAKVRLQHAFQISLALDGLKDVQNPVVVDIGDSSGTHLAYLRDILKSEKIKGLSINLDPLAVDKIRARGFDAKVCRAEDLSGCGIRADVFLCFEVLEHLLDPISFLHGLSKEGSASSMVITVPYTVKSRVGLQYVRNNCRTKPNAENTHIYELSPEDWKLVFRHSGWEVKVERILRQYPLWSPLVAMKPFWRKLDFEGFYGVVLVKNPKWSSLYSDW